MTLLAPASLVDLAADALRDRILSGVLKPGERLLEEQLAAELGISRPPLREALRLIQSEGLVQSLPRRGTIVAPLGEKDAWEIATLRSALERTAMELALPIRRPEQLDDCRDALQAMAAAAASDNRTVFVRASFHFHLAVVHLARHDRLTATYKSLYLQMQLCMALNVQTRVERLGESLRANVQRHAELLRLIERGNLQEVLSAFVAHGERTFLTEIIGGRIWNDEGDVPEASDERDAVKGSTG
jgi:DNA-binding GntR family transcriptional regulator